MLKSQKSLSSNVKKKLKYKKECNIVELMYNFEKDEISFTSERTKLVQLENLEVMLRHGVIP